MINILFDCKDFVICEKQPGLLSEHVESSSISLPVILEDQLGVKKIFTVHRLDKEVGGVMVYAKTQDFAAFISSQIASGDFNKEYLAVVSGKITEERGELKDLLFHDRSKNKTYVVKKKRSGVKEAVLLYDLASYDTANDLSTLKIKLLTGRTHQIRVQFASRGHAILGDKKYGSSINTKPIRLHSYILSFKDKNGNDRQFSSIPEWLPV